VIARKPLVLIDGLVRELPSGDTVDEAAPQLIVPLATGELPGPVFLVDPFGQCVGAVIA